MFWKFCDKRGVAKISMSLTTFLLCVTAVVAALVLGPTGLGISLEKAALPGLVCGTVACLMAIWVRSQWMGGLIIFLAITAVALAGPIIGFMFFFGLMTGLGALFALISSWDGAGMDGVTLQMAGLLLLAALMLSFFVSQAWAIMRAWIAWKQAADQ